MINIKDYATALIETAPTPALSGTTLGVPAELVDRFPDEFPFNAIVHDIYATDPSEVEQVLVTGMSGELFTIARGQNGTDAQPIAEGWRMSNTLLKSDLDKKIDSIVAGENVTVDNTDPANPVVSSTTESFNGTLSTESGNITIDPADGNTVVDGTMTLVAPGTTNTYSLSITNMGAGSTGINMSRNSGGASLNIGNNSGGIYAINATNGGGFQIWARGNGSMSPTRAALLFATDANAANGSMAAVSIQTGNNAKPLLIGIEAGGSVVMTLNADGTLEIAPPTADNHAATKKYVDDRIQEIMDLM